MESPNGRDGSREVDYFLIRVHAWSLLEGTFQPSCNAKGNKSTTDPLAAYIHV